MSDIKVGDKFKWIGGNGSIFLDNKIYTVCKVNNNNRCDFSDTEIGLSKQWTISPTFFEPVEEKIIKPRAKKEIAPKDSGWGFE